MRSRPFPAEVLLAAGGALLPAAAQGRQQALVTARELRELLKRAGARIRLRVAAALGRVAQRAQLANVADLVQGAGVPAPRRQVAAEPATPAEQVAEPGLPKREAAELAASPSVVRMRGLPRK